MVSGDQWKHTSMRFFFVVEERLSFQLCHLINCGLYFAMIMSSVSVVLLRIFSYSWKLEEEENFRNATDADSQTFRHTFESIGWATAR